MESGINSWVIVGSVNVDADELQTGETDDRGRVYLGTEYANKRVTVAVVEVQEDKPDEETLAAAYRDATDSAETLAAAWDASSTEAWSADADPPETDGADANDNWDTN